MNLEEQFEKLAGEYVARFLTKHGMFDDCSGELNDHYWVGDDVGEILCVGDDFINYNDLRHDVDNEIEPEKFYKWYSESLDAAMEEKPFPNYKNWLKCAIIE